MSACWAVRVWRPRRRSLDLVRWWVILLLSLVSEATVVEVGESERLAAEEWGLAPASTLDPMGEEGDEGDVGFLVLRN